MASDTFSADRLALFEAERERRKNEGRLLEIAEGSLRAFTELCWPIIEPATTFIPGWHIDAICDHLQAVTDGQIRKLIINVPPRHAKSTCVSVMWPAWEWLRRPATRWMFSSYSQSLAVRDSVKCRRLITSPFYKRAWGNRFKLTGDQNEKTRFENDQTGYRLATGVGGSNVGEGGDRIVCLRGDTLITTDSGPIPISKIVEDRLPVRILGSSGAWQQIEAYERNPGRPLIELSLPNTPTLAPTDDHLLFVDNLGYRQARLLHRSLRLRTLDRPISIMSAHLINATNWVYNLRVTPDHDYYANGVLTHNCDDPDDLKQIHSDTYRDGVNDWWDHVMSTRGNKVNATFTVIQQRGHQNDLSGHLLERGGYDHLCLPARWEEPLCA